VNRSAPVIRTGMCGAAAAAALMLGLTLTACGDDTPALPDVPEASVPMVGMPSIPVELPDADVDPAQAKRLICDAGNAWITADGAQRKLIEPPLRRLIGHYRNSGDEKVKNLAIAADALLTARQATRDAAASAFREQCGQGSS
jgi:predicted small lipoprotein YifL